MKTRPALLHRIAITLPGGAILNAASLTLRSTLSPAIPRKGFFFMNSRREIANWITPIVLGLSGALSLSSAAAAPTFTVNSVVDAVASAPFDNGVCQTASGNSVCTLRAAIMKANHFPGGGVTIIVPTGTYGLTITPNETDDELTGDLNVTASMTIQGAGAATTIVDANQIDRAIHVGSTATITISGLTIKNGSNTGPGGGILNDGVLTLTNSIVTGNQTLNSSGGNGSPTTDAGGGILSSKTLTLNNTIVTANVSAGNGGGVYADGSATLNDSSVTANRATLGSYGGGIVNDGTMAINRSVISGNQTSPSSLYAVPGNGGGIWNFGGLTMTNSTVSNNSAFSYGGGIFNSATLNTFFCTIAGNLADSYAAGAGSGGGIYNNNGLGGLGGGPPVNLRTTIVAQNYSGVNFGDLDGGITSQDYNLIQTTTGATINGVTTHNITGVNPLLDSLHANGGPTQTRALFATSPAIDAVPVAQCTDQVAAPLTIDQRGSARGNGPCDIGAYEGAISISLYGRNLVVNGDAEGSAGSPAGAFVGTPGWGNIEGQFTAVPYDAPGGFPSVATDQVPANHGYSFFSGGNVGNSYARQDIPVSAIGAQIDNGNVTYNLSADLGGFFSDGDNATVDLLFLDASNAVIGTPKTIGPVTPADRGNKTGLLPRSISGFVPPNTRTLHVNVSMNRSFGTANDGYADNISVVLTPPNPTPTPTPTATPTPTPTPTATPTPTPTPTATPTPTPTPTATPTPTPTPTATPTPAPATALANISTRLRVETGDNVLFAGFIITGTQPKKVIIRALGPSTGVIGALADPVLELYSGSTLLESNDNWVDSPNKQAIIDSTIPPTNNLESAIVRSVAPGNYTAIMRGVNNGTGIGVVEAYDLDRTVDSKLANISTRGFVQTGDDVLFAGTIVVGQASQKVIIRALGPSTRVIGAMADPTLELHDSNGALLEANDNWVDSPNKQAIIDSTIPPTNNLESAIVRTLSPANYTAIVRGANNTTGIAVVEVYALQ
jgi:hypothetical protein